MEYIFEEEQYENETVVNEAYRMCVKDLTTRAETEVQLFDMARDNAKATVKALIEPWVKQVEEYSIEII